MEGQQWQFLSTPLREGRPDLTSMSPSLRVFLSTPLREGRLYRLHSLPRRDNSFYPRPCVRGDIALHRQEQALVSFYPRPCVRGDAHHRAITRAARLFLSTPLREGRRGRRPAL